MPELVAMNLTNDDFDAMKNGTGQPPVGAPVLEWNDLTYSVGDGAKTILSKCSGRVYAGQVCAILGPSGKQGL